MLAHCSFNLQNAFMPVITIRDVPKAVRDELAAKAARQRKSMQAYLRDELERIASRPSLDEWLESVRERKSAAKSEIPADAILNARDADRRVRRISAGQRLVSRHRT